MEFAMFKELSFKNWAFTWLEKFPIHYYWLQSSNEMWESIKKFFVTFQYIGTASVYEDNEILLLRNQRYPHLFGTTSKSGCTCKHIGPNDIQRPPATQYHSCICFFQKSHPPWVGPNPPIDSPANEQLVLTWQWICSASLLILLGLLQVVEWWAMLLQRVMGLTSVIDPPDGGCSLQLSFWEVIECR